MFKIVIPTKIIMYCMYFCLGHFCPTGVSITSPCLPGTFANITGLHSAKECLQCIGGMYCDGYGLTKPRGLCAAGFFCRFGSNSSTPHTTISGGLDLPNADVCPRGYYCPQGTSFPQPCPQGRYGGSSGLKSLYDCLGCPAGSFCEGTGNIKPSGLCSAGYYCSGFAWSRMQNQSLPGYFSHDGSAVPSPCLPGTFSSSPHSTNCTSCPAGYYCPQQGMTTYVSFRCPIGSYCTAGRMGPDYCPSGTYGPHDGLGSSVDCLPCPPGSYCEGPGTSPSFIQRCSAGYYCTLGAKYSTQDVVSESGGPCSFGHYCPSGASSPVECPVGTFMNSTRATGVVLFGNRSYSCNLCPPGMACPKTGIIVPVVYCNAGYFCGIGAPSAKPVCEVDSCVGMYGLCPQGYYCPAKSSRPMTCEDGYYAPISGLSQCIACPAGTYCLSGSKNPMPCPRGYYCESGTGKTYKPCPPGKFGNREGLVELDECSLCPEGQYCSSSGLKVPDGVCSEGFYCPLGSMDNIGKTVYEISYPCPAG